MKKLFIGFISSCMLMFVIWTIIAYINYGNNMINVRLDLYTTITRFGKTIENKFELNIYDLLKDFKSGIEKMLNYSITGNAIKYIGGDISTFPTGFQLLLTVAIGFIEPIWTLLYSIYVLIYLVAIIFELVVYILSFIFAIYEFILNPVFIEI